MFRFMQRFGRDSQARWRGTGPSTRVRRRNHRLNCEALESRQLLSGYYIVNGPAARCSTTRTSRPATGPLIDQCQLNGGANQQWNLVPLADGNRRDRKRVQRQGRWTTRQSSKSNGTRNHPGPAPTAAPTSNGGSSSLPNGNDEVINAYSGQGAGRPGILDQATGPTIDAVPAQRRHRTSSGSCWRRVTPPP